jgi:hypothetical protein
VQAEKNPSGQLEAVAPVSGKQLIRVAEQNNLLDDSGGGGSTTGSTTKESSTVRRKGKDVVPSLLGPQSNWNRIDPSMSFLGRCWGIRSVSLRILLIPVSRCPRILRSFHRLLTRTPGTCCRPGPGRPLLTFQAVRCGIRLRPG